MYGDNDWLEVWGDVRFVILFIWTSSPGWNGVLGDQRDGCVTDLVRSDQQYLVQYYTYSSVKFL